MKNLSELGEFGLIARINKLSGRQDPAAVLGIGDDAAVMDPTTSSALLATTDLLLEGIHFDLSYTDYYSLGWKSAAVNLSDIAAMGGKPRFCLTALGIPSSVSAAQVIEFYRGVTALLARHKTTLIGGDTCSSRRELFISVTALGEAKRSSVIPRSGAKPGDRIFVTNTLGEAAAGLELLQSGVREQAAAVRRSLGRKASPVERVLLEKHLRPMPRVKEGLLLSGSGCASAMIDISDGLSSDLFHICEQSGVGAEIREGAVPGSEALIRAAKRLARPWLSYALSGGEDYELLFTVPPRRIARLRSLKLPVTEIGTITSRRSVLMVSEDGNKVACERKGYDHFAGKSERRVSR